MDSLHDHRVNGTSTNVGRHWTSTYLDNQTEENMTVLKSQVSLYACDMCIYNIVYNTYV